MAKAKKIKKTIKTKKTSKSKLTLKQETFCQKFVELMNGTKAALEAGYSPDSAYSIACENLKKPEIKAAIEKAMAERSARCGINADRVLMELAKIGFVNIRDVVNLETGEILPDAKEEDLACVQFIKVKPTELGAEHEVKMYDKKAALVDLGRHLGLFKDTINVTGLDAEKTKLDSLIEQMRGDG